MASTVAAVAAIGGGTRLIDLISKTLSSVRTQITAASVKAGRPIEPRLVAVSKTKPAHYVKAAYDLGHRSFGENYVQELIEKAPLLPSDIQWHYIGHLQRNKCKQILSVPNLHVVETVDSEKLAAELDKQCKKVGRKKLRVMVQVNTSGEASKSGCEPHEAPALAKFVNDQCKSLDFTGLMTIGRYDENPKPDCFEALVKCRAAAAAELKVDAASLELSMGMSADLELSVLMGSTSVRVGTAIFGVRDESLVPADALAGELKEATYAGQPERKTLIPETSTITATGTPSKKGAMHAAVAASLAATTTAAIAASDDGATDAHAVTAAAALEAAAAATATAPTAAPKS